MGVLISFKGIDNSYQQWDFSVRVSRSPQFGSHSISVCKDISEVLHYIKKNKHLFKP